MNGTSISQKSARSAYNVWPVHDFVHCFFVHLFQCFVVHWSPTLRSEMTSRVFEIFPVKQSNMIVHDSQALEIFESLQPHGFLTYIDKGPIWE